MEATEHSKGSSADVTRLMYVGFAVAFMVLMLAGFRHFYVHGQNSQGKALSPETTGLVITHGVSITLWLLLFAIQSILVAKHKFRMHMKLGALGAFLAIVVFVTGFMTTVEWVRHAPPSSNLRQFMAVPISDILSFGVFVSLAIAYRGRSHIHRPMMLAATLATMSAAAARVPPIASLFQNTFWGSTFGPNAFPILLGMLFLVMLSLANRRLDRWFAVNLLAIILVGAGAMAIAPTPAWEEISAILLGL